MYAQNAKDHRGGRPYPHQRSSPAKGFNRQVGTIDWNDRLLFIASLTEWALAAERRELRSRLLARREAAVKTNNPVFAPETLKMLFSVFHESFDALSGAAPARDA